MRDPMWQNDFPYHYFQKLRLLRLYGILQISQSEVTSRYKKKIIVPHFS